MSVCPIFENPPKWFKTLSNSAKTHLLKFKTSKFSQGGYAPPPATCWGKNDMLERGGGNDWDAQYIPLVGGHLGTANLISTIDIASQKIYKRNLTCLTWDLVLKSFKMFSGQYRSLEVISTSFDSKLISVKLTNL